MKRGRQGDPHEGNCRNKGSQSGCGGFESLGASRAGRDEVREAMGVKGWGLQAKSNGEPRKYLEQGRSEIRFAFDEGPREEGQEGPSPVAGPGWRGCRTGCPSPTTSPCSLATPGLEQEGEPGGGTWQPKAQRLMNPVLRGLFLAAAPLDA